MNNMITQKKFNRLIKKLRNFINNPKLKYKLPPSDLIYELEKNKFWSFWCETVRLNYYPNNPHDDIKMAREKSLPTFIKHFKNKLI